MRLNASKLHFLYIKYPPTYSHKPDTKRPLPWTFTSQMAQMVPSYWTEITENQPPL